jgi:hypothetical protein
MLEPSTGAGLAPVPPPSGSRGGSRLDRASTGAVPTEG